MDGVRVLPRIAFNAKNMVKGARVANYRIYLMDWVGVHIEDFAPISALCDADAISAAERRADRQPIELWLGGRLVCKLAKGKAGQYPAGNYAGGMIQAAAKISNARLNF